MNEQTDKLVRRNYTKTRRAKQMKIFEPNREIKTYKYPAIKLIVCVAISILLYNRDQLFYNSEDSFLSVTDMLAFIIGTGCFLCVFAALDEIYNLHMWRKEAKKLLRKCMSENMLWMMLLRWYSGRIRLRSRFGLIRERS